MKINVRFTVLFRMKKRINKQIPMKKIIKNNKLNKSLMISLNNIF